MDEREPARAVPVTRLVELGESSFFGFPRCGPQSVLAADVLLCGVPWDGGVSHRPGARLGPRAIREASLGLGTYADVLGVDVARAIVVMDGGDLEVSPHSAEQAMSEVAARAEALARSGVLGGFVGGDQTITLGALRGIRRAKLKRVGVLHIDAATDTLGAVRGTELHHRSVFRLAVEEGLIEPGQLLHLGVRGPQVAAGELEFALAAGSEVVKIDAVKWDLHSVMAQVRELARRAPLYVSVDLTALDPAHAPGVSRPMPGGMNTWDLQQILRGLVGASLVGFDVVEANPAYDVAGLTALAAASVLHEVLAVFADTSDSASLGPGSTPGPRRGRRVSA